MASIDILTFNTLKHDISNLIHGGITSDDSDVSLRQIGFWILNTRAELLSQWVSKGHSFSDNFVQTLDCVDVELVDLSSCCGITTECTAYKTELQLPKPLSGQYSDLITRVTGINFIGPSYHLIPLPRVKWELDNKFTFNIPKAFLSNGFLYVVGNNLIGLKKISVEGVWEDPTDVARFINCEGQACYTDNSRFPLSRKMVEMMKRMIKGTDLDLLLGTSTDEENDARELNQTTKVRSQKNQTIE